MRHMRWEGETVGPGETFGRKGPGGARMTKCRRWPRTHAAAARLSIALAALAYAGTANAQAENEANARSLFNEAKKLMKGGQYADACPKLEAAARLYSSAGILLNLGDCYEKIGRTASAWAKFNDAQSVAGRTARGTEKEEASR